MGDFYSKRHHSTVNLHAAWSKPVQFLVQVPAGLSPNACCSSCCTVASTPGRWAISCKQNANVDAVVSLPASVNVISWSLMCLSVTMPSGSACWAASIKLSRLRSSAEMPCVRRSYTTTNPYKLFVRRNAP
eukprot:GHRR01036229.1.p1 GENE.GHRR01036229.1~~GHRR01036229.1.p1  ORF type:complete len:146 (+),score=22.48 GHRR01036229.1:48-440(+)